MLIHRQTTTEQMRIRSDVRSLQHVSFLLVVGYDCTSLPLHSVLCGALCGHTLLSRTVDQLTLDYSEISSAIRRPVSPEVATKVQALANFAHPRLGDIGNKFSPLVFSIDGVG